MNFQYPLKWPQQKSRTPQQGRKIGRFSQASGRYGGRKPLTLTDACGRLSQEIEAWTNVGKSYRINPDRVVITSDLASIRGDGMPCAKQGNPADPGIAIYFSLDGEPLILAIDTFTTIEQNIAGAAFALDKLRALDRHGISMLQGDLIVRLQLPAAGQTKIAAGAATPEQWWQVLQVLPSAPLTVAEASYRKLSKQSMGNQGQQLRLNLAIECAREYLATPHP